MAPRSRSNELVMLIADLIDGSVDGIGDLIRSMAGDVLFQRGAEDLAPRTLRALGEPFHFLEDIIGNRHGRFHTASMTLRPVCAVSDDRQECLSHTSGGVSPSAA